jgi:hemoglobin
VVGQAYHSDTALAGFASGLTKDNTGPMTSDSDNIENAGQTAFELLCADPSQRLGIVRQLVDAFYDEMHTNAEFRLIRDLHPADLADSRDKLYKFLCGWLGGPDLYIREYGHPRLRMRHMPFPIASVERDQWLLCMARALKSCQIEDALAERLLVAFFKTADFMRNRPDGHHA